MKDTRATFVTKRLQEEIYKDMLDADGPMGLQERSNQAGLVMGYVQIDRMLTMLSVTNVELSYVPKSL